MFSKIFVLASLVAFAFANDSECDSGPVQCCQTVGYTSDPSIADQLSLIGIVAQGASVLAGLECNPITGIGAGFGSACSSQPLCCKQNFDQSLVGVDCTPLSVLA